jgi:hypothetical protein
LPDDFSWPRDMFRDVDETTWFDPDDLTDDEVEIFQRKDAYVIWCCNVGNTDWPQRFADKINRKVYGPTRRVWLPQIDPAYPGKPFYPGGPPAKPAKPKRGFHPLQIIPLLIA